MIFLSKSILSLEDNLIDISFEILFSFLELREELFLVEELHPTNNKIKKYSFFIFYIKLFHKYNFKIVIVYNPISKLKIVKVKVNTLWLQN